MVYQTLFNAFYLFSFKTINSNENFLWFFFLITFIIGSIVLGAILIFFSNKPLNWEHVTINNDDFPDGRLNKYANSINLRNLDNGIIVNVKERINQLFLEKIAFVYDLNFRDVVEMKYRNPDKLAKLINDDEINKWLTSQNTNEKKTSFLFFSSDDKEKISNENLKRYMYIINRMEEWGK